MHRNPGCCCEAPTTLSCDLLPDAETEYPAVDIDVEFGDGLIDGPYTLDWVSTTTPYVSPFTGTCVSWRYTFSSPIANFCGEATRTIESIVFNVCCRLNTDTSQLDTFRQINVTGTTLFGPYQVTAWSRNLTATVDSIPLADDLDAAATSLTPDCNPLGAASYAF